MEAQNIPLAAVLGDDIKRVLSIEGYDLIDVGMTFEISAGPEQPGIINGGVTVLEVFTDEDGVDWSIIQIFAAAATVRSAVAGIGGLPGNEPLTLFGQLKFDELPGDLGAGAITTILFGDFVMEGAVNG